MNLVVRLVDNPLAPARRSGALDDITWTVVQMEKTTPMLLWWSVGVAVTIATVSIWLAYIADAAAIRDSTWTWPVLRSVHALSFVVLIGLRAVIDLRLTTALFRELSVTNLVHRLSLGTLLAAAITAASGLLLYVADPGLLSNSGLFKIKIFLLAMVSLNIWYMHGVALRGAGKWDPSEKIPAKARMCACCSGITWITCIVVSFLVPYAF